LSQSAGWDEIDIMRARRLIVHCGLHKTGTTALQHFLLNIASPLRQLGVLYPRAGRDDNYGGGHHNLAWQLTRDRRYDPAVGGVERLADEVSAFDGDVLLSSEDFESCLDRLWQLEPLLRHPKLQPFRCVLVIYLRDQISYAESLYLELLIHGLGDECLPTMIDIVQRHALGLKEWRYQFDFNAMLARARAISGLDMVFRSYASLAGGSIVPDFMGILLPGAEIPLDTTRAPRVHERLGLQQSLSLFYRNRARRKPTRRELAACWLLQRGVESAPIVLPHALRAAFVTAFDSGNASFIQATGLPFDDLRLARHLGPAPADACFMDRVFSFETQQAIAALSFIVPETLLPRSPTPIDPGDLPANVGDLVQRVHEGWRHERR
jgi:hypothetical protein